jgi:hypothetical protein
MPTLHSNGPPTAAAICLQQPIFRLISPTQTETSSDQRLVELGDKLAHDPDTRVRRALAQQLRKHPEAPADRFDMICKGVRKVCVVDKTIFLVEPGSHALLSIEAEKAFGDS